MQTNRVTFALTMCASVVSAYAEPLPEAVLQARREAQESCSPGKAIFARDYMQVADITGEGKPDYVISDAGLSCEPFVSICGTHMCNAKIVYSTPSGYKSEDINGLVVKVREAVGGLPIVEIRDRNGISRLQWKDGRLIDIASRHAGRRKN